MSPPVETADAAIPATVPAVATVAVAQPAVQKASAAQARRTRAHLAIICGIISSPAQPGCGKREHRSGPTFRGVTGVRRHFHIRGNGVTCDGSRGACCGGMPRIESRHRVPYSAPLALHDSELAATNL